MPSVIVSLLLLCAFVGAGWTVFPIAHGRGELRHFAAPGVAYRPDPDGTLPVFVLRPDGTTVRNGVARADPQGGLAVELYRHPGPEVAGASEALLFDPGVGVLWAAAPEAAHRKLIDELRAVQDEVGHTLERVMGDDVFVHDYRPAMRAILADALSQAWNDPRTRAAFDDLLDAADPVLRDLLHQEAGAVLQHRLETAFWEFLKANWTGPVDILIGNGLDYAPLHEAIAGIMRDQQLQDSLLRSVNRLIDTPQAQLLAERMAIGTIDALLRDRRIPDLASRLYLDVRLQAAVQPLSERLVDLGAALPRYLGGLGSERSLNPLAAHVFKALTLNAPTSLILLVTPAERAQIAAADPEAGVALRPVTR
ncbi:MAG: hypothetical protein U1E53_10545 [Dongiaceae bacterium]